jgi:hypothetical protein
LKDEEKNIFNFSDIGITPIDFVKCWRNYALKHVWPNTPEILPVDQLPYTSKVKETFHELKETRIK